MLCTLNVPTTDLDISELKFLDTRGRDGVDNVCEGTLHTVKALFRLEVFPSLDILL